MVAGTCLQRAVEAGEIGHNGVAVHARAVACAARACGPMGETGKTTGETGGDLHFEPVEVSKTFSDGLEEHGDCCAGGARDRLGSGELAVHY